MQIILSRWRTRLQLRPSGRRTSIRPVWLALPALLLVVCLILLPSADTLLLSFLDPAPTLRNFLKFVERGVYLQTLWRTVQIAAVVSVLCLILGYPVSYYIVNQKKETQVRMLLLFLIPMWTSVLIRSYVWVVLLGRTGIVNSVLLDLGIIEHPLKLIFTGGAVYVAMVQILLPIQIINCYTAMKDIDIDLIRASRSLGASQWQAMRRVFIPLSLDGTITGTSIVFMLSTGFFIVPALVGGPRESMMANLISFFVTSNNSGFAAALGVILLIAALLGVAALRLLGRAVARWMV